MADELYDTVEEMLGSYHSITGKFRLEVAKTMADINATSPRLKYGDPNVFTNEEIRAALQLTPLSEDGEAVCGMSEDGNGTDIDEGDEDGMCGMGDRKSVV